VNPNWVLGVEIVVLLVKGAKEQGLQITRYYNEKVYSELMMRNYLI